MKSIKVHSPSKDINGELTLSGSKSISNRVLLIQALCTDVFPVHHLSDSDDTVTMQGLLASKADLLDAHHAGTTFRFMTAYLATQAGTVVLTGSERMQQRPVKALVDALNYLGAHIEYINNEGYPPLRIHAPTGQWKSEISLPADISSQFITALLLIAPTLPNGLTLHLIGDAVSRPYIEMTIGIMAHFGVQVAWEGQTLTVESQSYIGKEFYVEADWSAASYYYAIATLSNSADITLKGLHQNSLQGDSAIAKISNSFGIETQYGDRQITITKKSGVVPPTTFEYDFIKEPDIAQSVSVICAGLGISSLFSGLQTLRIKETDRIAALQNELGKVQVALHKMPAKFSKNTGIEYYLQEGSATADEVETPTFDTYNDHRMAMAFAPLGLLFPIQINDPMVVSKSYPYFWRDLKSLDFDIE